MKRFTFGGVLFGLVVIGQSFAQSGAVIPQGGAGHAKQATCVILKRMGPADQVTSRLYSFGIRGKQFQYVEGKLPDGFPFHGRLTDHDVRNLQARGAELIVLNQNFTSEELKQARADCRGETGATPNQAEEKAAPSQGPAGMAVNATTGTAPNSVSQPSNPTMMATLDVSSSPSNADIEIDGKFAGNTPSSVGVAGGEHSIRITKKGFGPWERKIGSTTGTVRLSAELDPLPGTAVPAAVAPSKNLPADVKSAASLAVSPTAKETIATTSSSNTDGTASITSTPDGAEIFIDSVGRGHAPALLKLKPGKHQVQLVLAGYKDWTTDVDIKADSIVNVTGTLER